MKKIEKNNVTDALNALYAKKNKKYIPIMLQNKTQIVKENFLCSKKLAVSITSKHHGDFYCLNYFHSFVTEKNLNRLKEVWEKKDFCNLIMPSIAIKILKSNQYEKNDKALFIYYSRKLFFHRCKRKYCIMFFNVYNTIT